MWAHVRGQGRRCREGARGVQGEAKWKRVGGGRGEGRGNWGRGSPNGLPFRMSNCPSFSHVRAPV
eukprot:15335293-Alexandrium_andersonii.AAC.1